MGTPPERSLSAWSGRRVLLAIGGGIAVYKLCEVASTLGKAGADVQAVLTESAQRFVTPLSFSTLCRRAALTDADFWAAQGRPLHIELGEWAEVILLAPLTANSLAKLAHGLADNLLTNTILASTCPVLLAPAMNTDMWQQISVQRNWALVLRDPRFHAVGPGAGLLACDRIGPGRMAEPNLILAQLQSLLHSNGQRDLAGKRILISAGGTREFLDSVRFIGNPSTGRMGLALAQAAQHRGAQVTLVHGPMSAEDLASVLGTHSSADQANHPQTQTGVQAIAVTTADEMQAALQAQLAQHDWVLMAAAVADVRPAARCDRKLPKAELPAALPLMPVPDLIAGLAQRKAPHQKIVGFAAQTGDIVTSALAKLERKGLDAIVANPIDVPQRGFGSEFNQGMVFDRQGRQWAIDPCTKLTMAHKIYDIVAQL